MWKPRRNCGPYYYRSIREGDRVRSVYVGRGEKAESLAREIAQRREARVVAARKRAEIEAAEDLLRDYKRLVGQILEAMAPSIGIRQHHRQWRRSEQPRETKP